MSPKEMGELILEWGKNRTEPFMTADAFNEIDVAQDATEVSNGMAYLYRKGLLARKKIDNVRFSYAFPEIAPDDYETIQPEMAKALLINEMKSEHETEAAPHEKEKPAPINETPARKTETKAKQPAKTQARESVGADGIRPDGIIQSNIGEIKIPVPENFVLSLQTPSGLIITIKTGIL